MKAQGTLKQLLVHQLSPGFVKGLIEGMRDVYRESYNKMTNDPNLGEEQGKYVLGHYRRGMAEALLSRLAGEHGINQELVQPDNGGCKHVSISAGQFSFSLCHVHGTNTFPRHSDNREQSAQINEHIPQFELFPIGYDTEKSQKEQKMYGVVIHSEMGNNKAVFGSIKIGFPNTNFDGWIDEPICMMEISDLQDQIYQQPMDLQGQIQNPKPKWKKQKPSNDENTQSAG